MSLEDYNKMATTQEALNKLLNEPGKYVFIDNWDHIRAIPESEYLKMQEQTIEALRKEIHELKNKKTGLFR